MGNELEELEELASHAYSTFWAPVFQGGDCLLWSELHPGTKAAWLRVVRMVQASTICDKQEAT